MREFRATLNICYTLDDFDLSLCAMKTELKRRSFDPNGPSWATYVRAENARAEWIEAMYALADYLDGDGSNGN